MPGTLSTITRPLRSRIVPRGASIRIVRSWLPCAAARYVSPERTCSDQSRKNSTANTASASTPRTPTRSARPGVSRYGASTPGSGGRNRDEGALRSPYGASDNAHLMRREEGSGRAARGSGGASGWRPKARRPFDDRARDQGAKAACAETGWPRRKWSATFAGVASSVIANAESGAAYGRPRPVVSP